MCPQNLYATTEFLIQVAIHCGYCMNRITICAVSNGRPSNRPKIVTFTLATAVSAKCNGADYRIMI